MLQVSDDVWAALGDSEVKSETLAQAQYQGRTADLNVVPEGGLTWDADGEIQSTGSLVAIGFGDSLVPRAKDDLLAPNGQEVSISRVVHLRRDDVTLPLGVYRITGNDGGRFNTREDVVLDWEVEVRLADRFRMLQRAKIIDPASPLPGATMYSELQRLSLFPLQRGVDDASVPSGMVYDTRLAGVHALTQLVGGKPRLSRQGALTVRPADRWLTETVPDFDITGAISWNDEQTDDFVNFVWVYSNDGMFSAFSVNTDDSDPRSVNRAGPSTYEHSSPVYTSTAAAQEGADTARRRLQDRRSRVVTVELGAQGLLLELSDFGWVRDPDQNRAVLGEVRGLRISHDPTEPIQAELVVAEEA